MFRAPDLTQSESVDIFFATEDHRGFESHIEIQ
ncbi:hypothetical protein BH10BAC3_BH10BAC3_35870 [soil metagenome]